MKKSKLFSLMAMVLAALMVLAACTPAANNDAPADAGKSEAQTPVQSDKNEKADAPAAEPVTITYCNFNSSGGNEETLAKMVAAFEDEHPNIKVEVETIGYDDYFTQMQTRVAGGTAPDCYELNIENFAAYANKGLLAEISGVDVSGLNDSLQRQRQAVRSARELLQRGADLQQVSVRSGRRCLPHRRLDAGRSAERRREDSGFGR